MADDAGEAPAPAPEEEAPAPAPEEEAPPVDAPAADAPAADAPADGAPESTDPTYFLEQVTLDESDDDFDYKFGVSYVEIYNEKVKDLLNPDSHADLEVREDARHGTSICI